MSKIFRALERAEQDWHRDPGSAELSSLLFTEKDLGKPRVQVPPEEPEYERVKVMLSLAAARSNLKLVMLLSARPAEGVSTVTAGLGRALAAGAQHGVLLIDPHGFPGDLASGLGASPRWGLGEILTKQVPWTQAVAPCAVPRVFVLAGDPAATDFTQARCLDLMNELLDGARSDFDYVVVDGGSLQDSPTSLLVARRMDGVVLVVDTEGTSITTAQAATSQLRSAGVPVLGVLLNRRRKYVPNFLAKRLGL